MAVVWLTYSKGSRLVYIYGFVMRYKMFSEEKLLQAGQKNKKVMVLKPLYSNTSHGLEHEKTASVIIY